MLAALAGIWFGQLEASGTVASSWRYMFLVGAMPAPLALLVFTRLREPEQWLKAKDQKLKLGSFAELFGVPHSAPGTDRNAACICRSRRVMGDRIFQF